MGKAAGDLAQERAAGLHAPKLLEEGEVFGFLGPNGAGKTTTIRTLLGFLRPSDGRAWVFGMEIRARVGNLPGEFALEDRMTGEELLRFFARQRGIKVPENELAERAILWDRWHAGRSGRTARQFVDELEAELADGRSLF